MEPKDRVETLVKTKASAVQQRIGGGDPPAGARLRVGQEPVDAILADWPAAPKKVAQDIIGRYGPPVEIATFDGSCVPYRTTGEVSATCDNEAANFLSMNLMHDIVQGTRTVDEARREFAEQTAAWALNRPAPYTERFHFDVPTGAETADPDESAMAGAVAHQTAEKVKDALGVGEAG